MRALQPEIRVDARGLFFGFREPFGPRGFGLDSGGFGSQGNIKTLTVLVGVLASAGVAEKKVKKKTKKLRKKA